MFDIDLLCGSRAVARVPSKTAGVWYLMPFMAPAQMVGHAQVVCLPRYMLVIDGMKKQLQAVLDVKIVLARRSNDSGIRS